jgi:hypothetical protein
MKSMGMTAPRPYRLADGRVVTPANPAPIWDNPLIAMAHDVQVVERLLGSARFSPEVEPALVAEPRRRRHERRVTSSEDGWRIYDDDEMFEPRY